MAQGYCPDCDNAVNLGARPAEGQIVSCNRCGAVLQVMSLAPVELDWADELDEGDEEEYEYEYEVDYDDDDIEDDDYDY